MPSTASYFRDEAGVHLNLHLTPNQYRNMVHALAIANTSLTDSVWEMITAAERHERNKADRTAEVMSRFDYEEDSHGAVVDDGGR